MVKHLPTTCNGSNITTTHNILFCQKLDCYSCLISICLLVTLYSLEKKLVGKELRTRLGVGFSWTQFIITESTTLATLSLRTSRRPALAVMLRVFLNYMLEDDAISLLSIKTHAVAQKGQIDTSVEATWNKHGKLFISKGQNGRRDSTLQWKPLGKIFLFLFGNLLYAKRYKDGCMLREIGYAEPRKRIVV